MFQFEEEEQPNVSRQEEDSKNSAVVVVSGSVLKIFRAANNYLCVQIRDDAQNRLVSCFSLKNQLLPGLLLEEEPVEFTLEKIHSIFYIKKILLQKDESDVSIEFLFQ